MKPSGMINNVNLERQTLCTRINSLISADKKLGLHLGINQLRSTVLLNSERRHHREIFTKQGV